MPQLCVIGCLVSAAFAQGGAQSAAVAVRDGSIAGAVIDAGTKSPLAGVRIVTGGPSRQVRAVTDASGNYALAGLDAGEHWIYAYAGKGGAPLEGLLVRLGEGEQIKGINLLVERPAEIRGRVMNENKEPVPGMTVFLMAREYSYSTVQHAAFSAATTNERGEYSIRFVRPGRPHLLLAHKRSAELPAISDVPEDPARRRPVFVPTYYPNSDSAAGAFAVTLRSGEIREDVDIILSRSPNRCLTANLQPPGGSGPVRFSIMEIEAAGGRHSEGGLFLAAPRGITGPDGRIRVCDLHAGEYHLTVSEVTAAPDVAPTFYASALVGIGDRDITDFPVQAQPGLPLSGAVVWAGEPPENPPAMKLTVSLDPLNRPLMPGEYARLRTEANVPGGFSFPSLLADEYGVRIRGAAPGFYVKDAAFGGVSVLTAPLRLGSTIGVGHLDVAVGSDGGTIRARVVEDDAPAGNAWVAFLHEDADTEPKLAAHLVTAQTDQYGSVQSPTLRPGQYYVLATTARLDRSPETISFLLGARSRAGRVEAPPKGVADITVALERLRAQ